MEQASGGRTYALVETTPRAIVIHCSDPRFQKAFSDFVHAELQLKEGEYIPLVVSGGVASLSEPLKLPKEFKFLKERIELFLEWFKEIDRIVLINHEDCRYYDAMKATLGNIFLQHFPHMGERQVRDLKAVATMLLGYVSGGRRIELYFAHITPEHTVRFEKIPLNK